MLRNKLHVVRPLLLEKTNTSYNLRPRQHDRQIWPVCNNGITRFTCHPHRNHTCFYSPASRLGNKGRYGFFTALWLVLIAPTHEGMARLSWAGWSHTEINVPHWELNLDTFTHPSTNRAWRSVTLLMCATSLPLSQAATFSDQNWQLRKYFKQYC